MKDSFPALVPSLDRCYLDPVLPVLFLQLDFKMPWGKESSPTSVSHWRGLSHPSTQESFASIRFSLPQVPLNWPSSSQSGPSPPPAVTLFFLYSGLPPNPLLLPIPQVNGKLLGTMIGLQLPLQAHRLLLPSDFILPPTQSTCCSLIGYAVSCL